MNKLPAEDLELLKMIGTQVPGGGPLQDCGSSAWIQWAHGRVWAEQRHVLRQPYGGEVLADFPNITVNPNPSFGSPDRAHWLLQISEVLREVHEKHFTRLECEETVQISEPVTFLITDDMTFEVVEGRSHLWYGVTVFGRPIVVEKGFTFTFMDRCDFLLHVDPQGAVTIRTTEVPRER